MWDDNNITKSLSIYNNNKMGAHIFPTKLKTFLLNFNY
jgi:hypothetical protein